MKFQDIQEARYHRAPRIVAEIEKAIQAAEGDSDDFPAIIEFENVEQAIEDITAQYGPPTIQNDDWLTWKKVGVVTRWSDNWTTGRTGEFRIDITLDKDYKTVEVY